MAESKRDYYEVLGVPKVQMRCIGKSIQKLTRNTILMPTQADKEAEAKFLKKPEAYSVLSDLRNVSSTTSSAMRT